MKETKLDVKQLLDEKTITGAQDQWHARPVIILAWMCSSYFEHQQPPCKCV
jgi:hypothetical protein